MHSSTKNTQYLPALTGIRAIAAYMVCIFHFNAFSVARVGTHVHNFFNEFHVGVTMFFVLSGFLISLRYFQSDHIDLKKYFVYRLARIYPVYFILTTFLFVFKIFHVKYTIYSFLVEYMSNILLVKGLFNRLIFTGISAGWSLTVEEMFYLLAPLLFLFVKKTKLALIIVPVLLWIFGYGLMLVFRGIPSYGFLENTEILSSFTFFGRSFEFMTGIALSLIYFKYFNKEKPVSRKYCVFTTIGVINCILCIWGISLFKGNYPFGTMSLEGKIINNIIMPVSGIAFLYWGLITERSWLSRLLSTELFSLLGKSSYVFYLIHVLVAGINENMFFVLVCATFFSIIIYKYIEEPLNKKVKLIFHAK